MAEQCPSWAAPYIDCELEAGHEGPHVDAWGYSDGPTLSAVRDALMGRPVYPDDTKVTTGGQGV